MYEGREGSEGRVMNRPLVVLVLYITQCALIFQQNFTKHSGPVVRFHRAWIHGYHPRDFNIRVTLLRHNRRRHGAGEPEETFPPGDQRLLLR